MALLPALPDLGTAHIVPEVILFQRFEEIVEAWRYRHLHQGPEVPVALAARNQEATPCCAYPLEGGQHPAPLATVETLVEHPLGSIDTDDEDASGEQRRLLLEQR